MAGFKLLIWFSYNSFVFKQPSKKYFNRIKLKIGHWGMGFLVLQIIITSFCLIMIFPDPKSTHHNYPLDAVTYIYNSNLILPFIVLWLHEFHNPQGHRGTTFTAVITAVVHASIVFHIWSHMNRILLHNEPRIF